MQKSRRRRRKHDADPQDDAPVRQHAAQGDSRVDQPGSGASAMRPGVARCDAVPDAHILDLPTETLFDILGRLDPCDLVAVGATCRVLEDHAQSDDLWRPLYRTAFGVDAPPPEHQDYRAFGKNVRWLYVVGLLSASTRKHSHWMATARRHVGHAVIDKGKVVRSGEFTMRGGRFDEFDRLILDGYGAEINTQNADGTRIVSEGVWSKGRLVGPARVQHDKVTVRCGRFVDGLADGQGRMSIEPNGDTYDGEFRAGKRHGFGTYVWGATQQFCIGEWANDVQNGRVIVSRLPDGHGPYAGTLRDEQLHGFGVMRLADASLSEALYQSKSGDAKGGKTLYSIWRASTMGTSVEVVRDEKANAERRRTLVVARSLDGDCVSNVDDDDAPLAYNSPLASNVIKSDEAQSSAAATVVRCFDDGTVICRHLRSARFEHPDGTLIVGQRGHIALLAISERFPDRRLAGARLYANDFVRPGSTMPPEAAALVRFSFGGLVARAKSWQARLYHLYLTSSHCHLDRHVVRAISAAIKLRTYREASKGASNTDPTDWVARDEAHAAKRVEAIERYGHYPFGLAFHNDDDDHEKGRMVVKCFLVGGTTPVAMRECVFLSTGRLYHETTFVQKWRDHAFGGHTDPQTGEPVSETLVHWRPWMADVPPRLLANIVRDTTVSHALPPHPTSENAILANVRYGLAIALDRLEIRGIDCVLRVFDPTYASGKKARNAAKEQVNVACNADSPLIRGFDGATLRNAELRHPTWSPRGRWASRDVALADLDPTLDGTIGEHERPGAAPLDHWTSHGVIHTILISPSFMGAHLSDVFFLGHRLSEASFVGARLLRCVFVGCDFDRCLFTRATLGQCAFYECTRAGQPCTTDAALAQIRQTGSL